MSDEVLIRVMERRDVAPAVDIHLKAFQGFFLSFLGSPFLRELYEAILDDASGIAFVSEEAGTVNGLVAGTAEPFGFYSRILRRRWWRFALAAIAPFVRRPSIGPRLFRALRKPLPAMVSESRGTLMSLAVDPREQRAGIGAALVRRFVTAARERGLGQIDLTTDAEDNEAVQGFYEKLGFRVSREFVTREGRKMREYLTDL